MALTTYNSLNHFYFISIIKIFLSFHTFNVSFQIYFYLFNFSTSSNHYQNLFFNSILIPQLSQTSFKNKIIKLQQKSERSTTNDLNRGSPTTLPRLIHLTLYFLSRRRPLEFSSKKSQFPPRISQNLLKNPKNQYKFNYLSTFRFL